MSKAQLSANAIKHIEHTNSFKKLELAVYTVSEKRLQRLLAFLAHFDALLVVSSFSWSSISRFAQVVSY